MNEPSHPGSLPSYLPAKRHASAVASDGAFLAFAVRAQGPIKVSICLPEFPMDLLF